MPPPIRLFVFSQPARAFYLSLLLFAGIIAITEVRREIPAPRGLIAGGVGALSFEEREDADDALAGVESSESEEQQGSDVAGNISALAGANLRTSDRCGDYWLRNTIPHLRHQKARCPIRRTA